jgi:hypothetical protein
MAAPVSDGYCSPGALFRPDMYQTLTIDTGRRPDLDQRLRADKTGTTLFKVAAPIEKRVIRSQSRFVN